MRWRNLGSDPRALDVWTSLVFLFHSSPTWMVAGFKRVHSNVRTSIGHLGVFTRARSSAVSFAVASYITAAYWFTASTSFANPAITIARSLSNTFAGIQPSDVPLFIVAQLARALAATFLFRWFVPNLSARADRILIRQGR